MRGGLDQTYLIGELLEGLPLPAEQESVNTDLDISLKLVHNANPTAKREENILRRLEWSGPMNRTEFYGLLHGSSESPSMSAKISRQILESLLKFAARTKAHEAFSRVLEAVGALL